MKTLDRSNSAVMLSLEVLRDDGKAAVELVAAAQELLLDDPQTAFDYLNQARELLASMLAETKRTHAAESKRGGAALDEFFTELRRVKKAA
jgi:hypothetical protein